MQNLEFSPVPNFRIEELVSIFADEGAKTLIKVGKNYCLIYSYYEILGVVSVDDSTITILIANEDRPPKFKNLPKLCLDEALCRVLPISLHYSQGTIRECKLVQSLALCGEEVVRAFYSWADSLSKDSYPSMSEAEKFFS